MKSWLSPFALISLPCLTALAAEPVPPLAPPSRPAVSGATQAATEPPDPRNPDGPITPALRTETITRLLKLLGEQYVFPDKAALVQKEISAKVKRGDYEAVTTGHALAKSLSDHINAVLHDAHFRVRYSREKIPVQELSGKEPTADELRRYQAESRFLNGGFEKVERLPGNIGYLEVRSFAFPELGGEAAGAAMSFLANTDALIIDIRRNGGGEPDLVAALCSYFFAKPVHLNDLYYRPQNETRQYWSFASVPGKRYLDREVYVLTSKKTGSGAEEFAYNLKNLKRATLIGESTWGGAHPGDVLRLSDHYSAFIPNGRAINPITKTNWEGTGVAPDIKVPAEDALRIAQIKALEKLISAAKTPEVKDRLEARLRELQK